MKFAVVEIAGKQYVVRPGQKIKTEKSPAFEKGGEIKLDKVLLLGDGDKVSVGQPLLEGAEVKAEILGNKRAKKVIVFRYRPKARVRVKRGHRQHYSELLIKDIKY
ncbi:MAG: 50S ribosomal protein L21 [Candidatus Niyogibacteria bacterium RIFCSPLOWO2_01_FULL_45_48]|uniref:Large ribosomal subunit protein bL21 n=2 Tax=Candidatus Niyogiibacteriota TaxID=1817912 RepID=A0A1G2EXW6_9BACT|nr:MAG: 50S ribosomal protein L21 [Candidatus Niyogibacteria bacterium RIFCSPLOWO2_02_FULL_45_13]OGZ31518.1 MAG: 50S ribosomal protein L21 [Candidatus Niyogibacteria bacterium RIFCSPLOWO2_01_FULL_45_48]